MSWVRKTTVDTPGHTCQPPTRERFFRIPSGFAAGTEPIGHRDTVPAGEWNDLWRCDDCGRLWRVGNSCDYCDPSPPGGRCFRGGYHAGGHAWRPATWWQRWRYPGRTR
jgi:hypothetical protein